MCSAIYLCNILWTNHAKLGDWSHFIVDHVHVSLRLTVKNVTGEILQKLTAFQFDFTIATMESCLFCVQTLHSEGIVFCSLNIDSQSQKAWRQTDG